MVLKQTKGDRPLTTQTVVRLHIAPTRLVVREGIFGSRRGGFGESFVAFRHGGQVVDYADGEIIDAFVVGFDVDYSEELISEILDGIESVGGQAEILVDQSVANKPMSENDLEL